MSVSRLIPRCGPLRRSAPPPDTTAPTLSNPADGTPSSDGTVGASVDTDEGNGTLYWAVLTNGGSCTDAQLKAGSGGDILQAGNQAVSGAGTQVIATITGLTATTDYELVFLHRDAAGNDSAQATVGLTTAAAGGAVAFDIASSGEEIGGDGNFTISHTSTGANLGGFVGVGWYTFDASGSAGVTWGTGTPLAMTELWDIANPSESSMQLAGYRIAGQASGAQNIVSTLVETVSLNRHFVGSVSLTGVHQTVPCGTPNTASGTASPATVTVAGVVADGMLCDALMMLTSLGPPSVGANQTLRFGQDDNSYFFRGSTQDGADGGVMSWPDAGPDWWSIGAVEFKPA